MKDIKLLIYILMICLGGCSEKKSGSPNIVFILTDDLGYGDVSFLNPGSKIHTPNIDALAGQGVWCSDAHSPGSLCSPTRYACLTGRYAWRGVLKSGVLKPWDEPAIEENRLTLPGMLKQKGYHTACIGKWHLGWSWPWKNGITPPREVILKGGTSLAATAMFDWKQAIKGGPLAAGFDYYYGDDVPNFPPYAFIENDHLTCEPVDMDPAEFVSMGQRGYIHGVGPGEAGWQLDQVMPAITAKAVDYIRRQENAGQPFFLFFTTTSPHTPVVPSAEFQGKSCSGYYGDYVIQTDDAVGKVIDALKETGQFENTLVIFSSDNGPEYFTFDLINEYGHYSMASWRGLKRDTWEGGHRVPFIASWPEGGVTGGTRTDKLISLTDVFATIAGITGFSLPETAAEDSYDVLGVLQGGKGSRKSMIYHNGNGLLALREENWVYIRKTGLGRTDPHPAWYNALHGVKPVDAPDELFNLETDPGERENLYNQYRQKAEQMETTLQEMVSSGRTRPAD